MSILDLMAAIIGARIFAALMYEVASRLERRWLTPDDYKGPKGLRHRIVSALWWLA